MIKIYDFEYALGDASVSFKVDTTKFTEEHAKATLEFFTWNYDEENNAIDEVMFKYALEAIKIATFNNYNTNGVIQEFKSNEGFCKVDGSNGITLIDVEGYGFNDDLLTVEIKD